MAAPVAPQVPPHIYDNREELKNFLAVSTIQTVRQITADSIQRLSLTKPENPEFTRDRAITALSGGVWYSTRYMQVFREMNQRQKFVARELQGLAPLSNLKKVSTGSAPAQFFKRVGPLLWEVKPEVSASDALDAALAGPTLTDCGGTCNLARHKALRDLWGKERYDKVFNGRLMIGYPPRDYLDLFVRNVPINEKGKYEMSSGKKALFINHPQYCSKHPFGFSQGMHVIYAGKGKYLGLEFPPEGLTLQEVNAELRNEFNKPIDRRLGGLISEEEFRELLEGKSEALLMSEDKQIAYNEVPGIKLDRTEEFDLEIVDAIAKLRPDEISVAKINAIYRATQAQR